MLFAVGDKVLLHVFYEGFLCGCGNQGEDAENGLEPCVGIVVLDILDDSDSELFVFRDVVGEVGDFVSCGSTIVNENVLE